MTTRKDEPKNETPDLTRFLGDVLDNEGDDAPEMVVTLLAPAAGQGFAYAIYSGGVALVVSVGHETRTETMTAEQARTLAAQLINAADVDDESW